MEFLLGLLLGIISGVAGLILFALSFKDKL